MGPTEHSVKISGVPEGTQPDEVRELFRELGLPADRITDVYLPAKFVKMGFGFVRFSEREDAEQVADMGSITLGDAEMTCELCINEKKRGRDQPARDPSPLPKRPRGGGAVAPVWAASGAFHDAGHGWGDVKGAGYGAGYGPAFGAAHGAGKGNAWDGGKGKAGVPSTGEYSVWVGTLPEGTSSDELAECFQRRGVSTMTDTYIPPGRGFGFVRFATFEEADHAMRRCDGLRIGGAPMELKLSTAEKRSAGAAPPAPVGGGSGHASGPAWGAPGYAAGMPGPGYARGMLGPSYEASAPAPRKQPPPDRATEISVKIGNLPPRITVDELERAFADQGVDGMSDVYIPQAKSFGFLRFQTRRDAHAALGLTGMVIGDREITCELAEGTKKSPQEMEGGLYDDFDGKGGAHGKGGFDAWGGKGLFDPWGGAGGCDPWGGKGGFKGKPAFDAWGGCGSWSGWGGGPYDVGKGRYEGKGGPCKGGGGFDAPNARGGGGAGGKGGKGTEGGEVSVKVSNLPSSFSAEALHEAFAAQGVETMTDCYIPPGRRFGFLRFSSMLDAEVAMSLSGMEIGDVEISCELAEGGKKTPAEMTAARTEMPMPYDDFGGGGFYGKGAFEGKGMFDGKGCKGGFGGKAGPAGGPVGGPVGGLGGGCAIDRGEVSVKVGNLPPDVTAEDLSEAFAAEGIDNMTDCYIPPGRKFGFLRFKSEADARPALTRAVSLMGCELEVQPAVGSKRSAQEMVVTQERPPPRWEQPMPWEPPARHGGVAPHDPHVSAGAPSVKVSGLPPGTASAELHDAFVAAGCRGRIADMYVPKGDRGFGFARFDNLRDAEGAARLRVMVRGCPVQLEIAVNERKAPPV